MLKVPLVTRPKSSSTVVGIDKASYLSAAIATVLAVAAVASSLMLQGSAPQYVTGELFEDGPRLDFTTRVGLQDRRRVTK